MRKADSRGSERSTRGFAMKRHLTGLVLFFAAALCAAPVLAEEPVKVAVFPFSVYAAEPLPQLPAVIAENLRRGIAKEGASATSAEKALPEGPLSVQTVAELAPGADYAVWGSFSKVGDRFSLDVSVMPLSGAQPLWSVYAEGVGMDGLSGKVGELASSISSRILGIRKVARVAVAGSRRVEPEAVLRAIKTRAGDAYRESLLSEDLGRIFAMGYFEDVKVEAEEAPEGMIVTFTVVTRATVRRVSVSGYRVLDREEVEQALDISRGSILNQTRIEQNIAKIRALYRAKNYLNAEIAYKVIPYENEEADLEFVITEGEKSYIREIRFSGAKAFSERKLKGLLKTKEKGFFSWLTSSGTLDPDDLKMDAARLTAFYHNNGYVTAKVADPVQTVKGSSIEISFKIEEGEQYRVGTVDLSGDLIAPKADLMKKTRIGGQKVYNAEILRADILVLSDMYSDEGYAYSDVSPMTSLDHEKRLVNINYVITKGQQVFFEEIRISGNTKTRDYVIRRELAVEEKGLYSGTALKRGLSNLSRLDYFSDIKVDTAKGSTEDSMILSVGVEEKPTGTFSFGGGYSSADNAFFMSSIGQRNLFGRGHTLNLQARIGGSSTLYNLAFTEPYFMGTRLSTGIDLYRWEKEYDDYTKLSNGGRLRFGYKLTDHWRVGWSYGYEVAEISELTEYAAASIVQMEGENAESLVSFNLSYDSRNRFFNPTKGNYERFTVDYAGGFLGGDIAYTKYTLESGVYIPLIGDLVGFVHAEGGYIRENSDGILPIYERFYLGGINSLRGYYWDELSPLDSTGAEIGGNKYVQANLELLYPILKQVGLVGLVFFDMGDVYDNEENIDLGNLYQSWGIGVRWYSPMGPIRLERGFPINPPDGVSTEGRWEFTMGTAF